MPRNKVDVIFNRDVEKSILNGCEKIARAVGSTHGPCGKNVILDTDTLYPTITKDGVSVAKELYELLDPQERMAAQILINTAVKQLYDCGDGTTAAIVIAYDIIKNGMKATSKGINPAKLREGIKRGCEDIVFELERTAQKATTRAHLQAVATIASNNNKALGEMIAEAVIKVGLHGIVDHGRTADKKHSLKFTDGYQWPKGLVSPYFMNNRQKLVCEFDSPFVLVTDHLISYVKDLIPLLTKIDEYNTEKGIIYPLVIVGEFNPIGEALAVLAKNANEGKIQCACVAPDGLASRKQQNLSDIAAVTGATFITREKGLRLEDVTVKDLGSCDKFKATIKQTMIIDGKGTTKLLQESMVTSIKDTLIDEAEKSHLNERLARLAGGVATIMVGGKTETEQQEAADRVDDAIRATKVARDSGIVAGGGCAYLLAKRGLDAKHRTQRILDKEVRKGYEIVMKAAEAPTRNILENASMNVDNVIRGISSADSKAPGYDAHERHNVPDMMEAGIIDPKDVVISALENAVSVASLLLVSKTMVVKQRAEINMAQEMKS